MIQSGGEGVILCRDIPKFKGLEKLTNNCNSVVQES